MFVQGVLVFSKGFPLHAEQSYFEQRHKQQTTSDTKSKLPASADFVKLWLLVWSNWVGIRLIWLCWCKWYQLLFRCVSWLELSVLQDPRVFQLELSVQLDGGPNPNPVWHLGPHQFVSVEEKKKRESGHSKLIIRVEAQNTRRGTRKHRDIMYIAHRNTFLYCTGLTKTVIPDICHIHHMPCRCKNFQAGVKKSWINDENVYFTTTTTSSTTTNTLPPTSPPTTTLPSTIIFLNLSCVSLL